MTEHTARAWREGMWWVIAVDGVGATQAKSLDKVDHMARALVADTLDVPYESVSVAVAIDLPDAIAQDIEHMKATAEQAAQLSRKATEMQRRLVGSLSDEALTGREIAVILRVTPGRVSQIRSDFGSKDASEPVPKPAPKSKTSHAVQQSA